MCQLVPMLERDSAKSLPTLGHTEKVYSFPLNKYIHYTISEWKIQQTHIVEKSLGDNHWISTRLHTCEAQMKCFKIASTNILIVMNIIKN